MVRKILKKLGWIKNTDNTKAENKDKTKNSISTFPTLKTTNISYCSEIKNRNELFEEQAKESFSKKCMKCLDNIQTLYEKKAVVVSSELANGNSLLNLDKQIEDHFNKGDIKGTIELLKIQEEICLEVCDRNGWKTPFTNKHYLTNI